MRNNDISSKLLDEERDHLEMIDKNRQMIRSATQQTQQLPPSLSSAPIQKFNHLVPIPNHHTLLPATSFSSSSSSSQYNDNNNENRRQSSPPTLKKHLSKSKEDAEIISKHQSKDKTVTTIHYASKKSTHRFHDQQPPPLPHRNKGLFIHFHYYIVNMSC